MVRMMGSSLEAGLGDIFNAPDERILKAVEKAGNRCCLNPHQAPQQYAHVMVCRVGGAWHR